MVKQNRLSAAERIMRHFHIQNLYESAFPFQYFEARNSANNSVPEGNQNQNHLYRSHPVVFITKQATLIQYDTTQIDFNSVGYPYMYATCFDLYLRHSQACSTKTIRRKIQ